MGWSIETLQDTLNLGLDFNNAHVQLEGKYHYHEVPESLVKSSTSQQHLPIIGFAADGHPFYIKYGYSDVKDSSSPVKEYSSSYRLKIGSRGTGEPSGNYDGTYTNDFEFDSGSGDLDDCNGIFTITPEYPEGTYTYFITEYIPIHTSLLAWRS